MSVVGLDFGCANAVIAAAGRGGVDVVLNGNSNRLNPNMVGFDRCRHMGEAAATSKSSNYKGTIYDMKRLVGLSYDDPRARKEMKLAPYTCVPIKHGSANSIGVKVSLDGEEKIIPIEAVAGMTVKHMGSIVAEKNAQASKNNDAGRNKSFNDVSHPLFPQDWVVAIPGYYTDTQRRAFLTGCEIVGIKGVLRLMHETTATALAYGIFKDIKKEFTKDQPTHVMFIDIGATSYSVSVVNFEPGKLVVKSTQYDPDLGGRDFDLAIAEWFAEQFEAKFKNKLSGKPMEKPKARIKLLAVAEKAKKTLSPAGVREASMNVECLMDDLDFHATLLAETYEKLCEPLIQRLAGPIERALEESKLESSDLASVEVVGGSTRIGCVKRFLSNLLKLDENATNYGLSTTMNADEAVARGAALQSAILSPRFRVAPYEIIEYNPFPISVSWESDHDAGLDAEQDVPNSVVMFDRGSNFPVVRRVTLRRSGEFEVTASYSDNAVESGLSSTISKEIAKLKIKAPVSDNKVRVNVKHDIHGIITLSSAQMVEEIVEEGAPPAKDEKAAEPMETSEGEAKKEAEAKKKKIKKTNLEFTIKRPLEWSKAEFDAAFEAEVDMANKDRVVKETSDMRNELESYIYHMRDSIISESQLAEYCTEKERNAFSAALESTENWLYEDGFDAVKSVYSEKLKSLKKMGDPVEFRKSEASERPVAISSLQRTIERYKNWLNASAGDEKYAHITDAEKQTCHEICDEISSWMYDMLDKQGSLPANVDPVFKASVVYSKSKELMDVVNPIMNKPAPKPVVEEKKKEEETKGPEPMDTTPSKEEPDSTEAKEPMDTTE